MDNSETVSNHAKKNAFVNASLLFILFASVAILVVLADRAPLELEAISSNIHISQKFIYYWQGVVYRFFPGPYLYRVFIPYSYLKLNETTHLSLDAIDHCTKIILLIACQYSLLKYLACFFPKNNALLGVFIFDSLLGYLLSYIKGPSIVETIDILNFLMITLGLISIYRKKFLQLSIILLIGLLNRETPIVLIPISFLNEWLQNRKFINSSYMLAISVIIFVAIKILITGWAGATWFNLYELKTNLPFLYGFGTSTAIIGNYRLIVLLLPFILFSVYKFSQHPQFLKIAICAVPMIIIVHYFVAEIIEARLWFPLFPFLIPPLINNITKLTGETTTNFMVD